MRKIQYRNILYHMILSRISQALSTHLIEIRFNAENVWVQQRANWVHGFILQSSIIIYIHRDNRKIVTKNQNIVT